jgi:hypothetical protein
MACRGVAVVAEHGEVVTLERCSDPECRHQKAGERDHLTLRVDGALCLHIYGMLNNDVIVVDNFSKKAAQPPALSEGEIAELLAR